jgi:hypothetical protein
MNTKVNVKVFRKEQNMSVSKLFRVLLGIGLVFGLMAQTGCLEELDPLGTGSTDTTTPADTTDNSSTTNPPAASNTPVVTVTSLGNDITVAQGQTVLLTWQIQNLPTGATMNVLYRATNEQNNKILIGNLATSHVGSLQIDTYNFIPGLTYVISLQLNAGGSSVATAQAAGKVTIASPSLTLTAPSRDVTLLPSSTLNITWTGKYLPAGAELQTFFDTDTTYNNGNELVLKTDTLPASSAQETGSITLVGSDLWNNAQVVRSNPYYIGLRVVKNGQTTIAGYASATAKLFGGASFYITNPLNQVDLRSGDSISIRWNTVGVPAGLKVQLYFADRADGSEITTGSDYNSSAGGATLLTNNLLANHYYDVYAKLLEGETVIAVTKASGLVYVTTSGSTVFVSNADLLDADDTIYLGLENTYTINWELVQPPVNGLVDLYLDVDGNFTTTGDQIKITPEGGLIYSLKKFDLTPTAAVFTDTLVGERYHVIARLLADGVLFDDNVSNGTIRIGAGGLLFTNPVADVDVQLGDTLDISWTLTGDICAKFPGRQKTLKLFVDDQPEYREGESQEITPLAGLDACGANTWTFDPSTLNPPLNQGTGYYIIGRLMVQGSEDDETRVSSEVQLTIPNAVLTVLTPETDIESGFDAINVTWEITGLNTTAMKVHILAVNAQGVELPIPGLYNPSDNAAIVDASKLPVGTYTIRCEVFGYDANGNEIPFASGNAEGKIIISVGYNGVYQLSDMAAAADPDVGYSPIDGTIFEGETLGDLSGYGLGSMGDFDGDGFDDFLIFSRYGKVNNTVKAGAGYLIYGKSDFKAVENLALVAANNPATALDGTVIILPMENSAMDLGGGTITGDFKVTPIPGASEDELTDLMVACPTAMPLIFTFENKDPDNEVTFVDYYGTSRTLFGGQKITEVSHVFPWFRMSGPPDAAFPETDVKYRYGEDYFAGNTIKVEFVGDETGHEWTVTIDPNTRNQRGTCYLLTSERLAMYRNKLFNMTLVGSPIETDDLTGTQRDQMLSWVFPNETYGVDIAVLPDMNSNDKPELLISSPKTWVIDESDLLTPVRNSAGTATMFDASFRGTHYDTDGMGYYSIGGDPSGGQGRLWRSSTYSGYLGEFIVNPEPITNQFSRQIDILGPTDNAALTSVSGFTGTSPQSVGGDFDGNGLFDMLIGTPGEDGGFGAIYVLALPRFNYQDTVTQLDLADFDTPFDPAANPDLQIPVLGVKIHGNAGDNLGKHVKAIGDFNGDGLADFVIALPDRASSVGTAAAGQVMIVFGKAGIPNNLSLTIDDLTSSAVDKYTLNALIFEGANANDKIGENICAVYDVNGDGYDDLLVAAPNADNGAKVDCGKIYLIYGKSGIIKTNPTTKQTSIDYDLDTVDDGIRSIETIGTTLPGAVFVGEASGDKLQSMSFAGDINGDGIQDFLIGAPYANSETGLQDTGKTYLILGRKYTVPRN